MNCPECGQEMMGVEYAYPDPNRYDGISEWRCSCCNIRIGRWTSRYLKDGEGEPRYGNGYPKSRVP